MLPKKERLKAALAAQGDWLVGHTEIPLNTPLVMALFSNQTNLDQRKLSEDLRLYGGIPNRPLLRDGYSPNVYPFIIYIRQGKPNLLTSEGKYIFAPVPVSMGEEVDNIEVSAVWKHPLQQAASEELIKEAEDRVAEHEEFWWGTGRNPIPLSTITAHEWVWLQVTNEKGLPPNTGYIAEALRNKGFTVLAPDKGFLGLITPGTNKYMTESRSIIGFKSNETITPEDLTQLIFPDSAIHIGAFTTEYTRRDQSVFDVAEGIQDTGESISSLLSTTQKLFSVIFGALRYLLWGALGAGVIYLAWNGYKYIDKEYRDYKKLRA